SPNIGYNRTASDWKQTMRAIGLVLLSIAIMAFLLTALTPSAGRARKGARRRGPAEAGARPIPGKASTTTAVLPRNNSVWPRVVGSVALSDLIRFRARLSGPATPGVQVRCSRAAAGSLRQGPSG